MIEGFDHFFFAKVQNYSIDSFFYSLSIEGFNNKDVKVFRQELVDIIL